MTKPAARPRPMGGFNSGFGNFSDEHLDENALQQAMSQKSLGQQQTSAAQSTTGGSALQPGGLVPGAPAAGAAPPPPREVSTLRDELITRPAHDVVTGLKSFFDINTLLGIDPVKDDPETQARKKQQLSRWQQLNQEQQQYAQQLFQQKMQEKKQREQEEQARKQQQEQQKAQSIEMPSSPKKGPVGPSGSGKQRASNKLEQDRKTLNGPASAN